jgi:hypothetical protein
MSTDFSWFDDRQFQLCMGATNEAVCATSHYSPNAIFERLEQVCESGITVFPLVFPTSFGQPISRPQMEAARYLATYTGGRMGIVDREQGTGVAELLDIIASGFIIDMQGEPVGRNFSSEPRTLRVSGCTALQCFSLERPFVLGPAGVIRGDTTNLIRGGWVFFFPRLLQTRVEQSRDITNLHILVPPSSGKIDEPIYVGIEYLDTHGRSMRRRYTFSGGADRSNGEVIIHLGTGGCRHPARIVATNKDASWVATSSMELPTDQLCGN